MSTYVRDRFNLASILLVVPLLGACGGDDGSPQSDGDGTGTTTGSTNAGSSEGDPDIICEPEQVRCGGQTTLERCSPTGREWIPEACGPNEMCRDCEEFDMSCAESKCIGPCDSEDLLPSSAGCSFIANRQIQPNEDFPDGIIIANPNTELVATVQLYQVPEGKRREEPVGEPFTLQPLETAERTIGNESIMGSGSMFRTGGMFRIESDVPVVAYQHVPLQSVTGNDSSMLLPESMLRTDYIALSYYPHPEGNKGRGRPSYFEIIALDDQTRVSWKPVNAPTGGNGLPIPFVGVGEETEILMNRFDSMRVTASQNEEDRPGDYQDVSGTIISSDKPIWVVGGVRCASVPVRPEAPDDPYQGLCDPLQEVLLPLDYWGTKYVAAHSPVRETERHHWRIFGGKEGVTVDTDPAQSCTLMPTAQSDWEPIPCEFPFTFEYQGQFLDVSVPNGENFMIEADGPVMPVQYLQSRATPRDDPMNGQTELGDPAMYQMVPVDQFLSRYVISTAKGFGVHIVQLIRQQGDAEVLLDGEPVTFTDTIADYEIAEVRVEEGSHILQSEDNFGVVQIGWIEESENPEFCPQSLLDTGNACHTSYAYPGGMQFLQLNVP